MSSKGAKGANFEREISKKLSLWWTGGERDDVFWRTSQSGGRASARAKIGKKTYGSYGDIAAVDPVGSPLIEKVTIELKRGYKKWSILDLIDKPERAAKQTFEKFLEQVKRDAKLAKTPCFMIIFKRDRREVCVAVSKGLYNLSPLEDKEKVISIQTGKELVYVMSFKSFLKHFLPGNFKNE